MTTRRVVLLGDPVEHSLSPAMQNAAFRAARIDAVYATRLVPPARLGAAVAELRGDPYLGANVTIPHKESVLGLVDERSQEVERIGAANTLLREGSRLRAENTDARGFGAALDEREVDVAGREVLVLGAGGAARACALELLRRHVAGIAVANRSASRAGRLVEDLGRPGDRVRPVAWPSRLDYALVVNTTPLGMRGEDPLEGVALEPPLVVFDLVPTGTETALLRRARAAGCQTVDGLLMLLHQAAASFRLWTGVAPPLEVMRSALPRRV